VLLWEVLEGIGHPCQRAHNVACQRSLAWPFLTSGRQLPISSLMHDSRRQHDTYAEPGVHMLHMMNYKVYCMHVVRPWFSSQLMKRFTWTALWHVGSSLHILNVDQQPGTITGTAGIQLARLTAVCIPVQHCFLQATKQEITLMHMLPERKRLDRCVSL